MSAFHGGNNHRKVLIEKGNQKSKWKKEREKERKKEGRKGGKKERKKEKEKIRAKWSTNDFSKLLGKVFRELRGFDFQVFKCVKPLRERIKGNPFCSHKHQACSVSNWGLYFWKRIRFINWKCKYANRKIFLEETWRKRVKDEIKMPTNVLPRPVTLSIVVCEVLISSFLKKGHKYFRGV